MSAFGQLRRDFHRTFKLLHPASPTSQRFGLLSRNHSSFVPKRVLILAKVSRYYFEKLRQPNIKEEDLKYKLLERGSDYEAMLASHHINKDSEERTTKVLRDLKIEYKVMDRLSIDDKSFAWADLILPIGGDGTFLFASNLIYDNVKPIMGINSDPASSEGYLMLPTKYSQNIEDIFKLLRAGQFSFMMRSRIRTTLKGEGIWSTPFHMHEKCRVAGEERFYVSDSFKADLKVDLPKERRLPWLALNEVFIGESLSARTSSLQMRVDDDPTMYKIKSSGLCVSTGTGSTSWHRAINSLSPHIVNDVLRIADPEKSYTGSEIKQICSEYNRRLQFSAEDFMMGYTIRDMIVADTWPTPKGIQPRGYCKNLTVRSHCFDAGLVLDGGIAVPFNDGTKAILEIRPEDALRTIVLA